MKPSKTSRRVLVFGTFDPLHEGHRNFFHQARALGDHLTVVVARDSAIRATKKREPNQPQAVRLQAVAKLPSVDEAMLGEERVGSYDLLGTLDFDVVALGYDQQPSDDTVRRELDRRGKHGVAVVRLKPYQPQVYKSSLLR